MSIPVPNLDDRRFQDLVDDAKRRIADRCPEWTDHNVSDPGVTLIELFAQMVEETIYRVNRIPEKLLAVLMNAVGMKLHPGSPARTRLTFWLSAPTKFWAATNEDVPMLAAPGVEVSTERTGTTKPVTFRTTGPVRPARAQVTGRHTAAGVSRAAGTESAVRREGHDHVSIFGEGVPVPGAALLIELANPVPGCAVKVELDCEPNRGTGVVPEDPPWRWEAWCRGGWQACEVDRDTTGGLNRSGAIYLHVPDEHSEAALPGLGLAAWLRCRVTQPRQGQSQYENSPWVGRISAETLGVSVHAIQAAILVRNEVVGVSDGTYGQPAFTVRNVPVVDDDTGGPYLYAGDDPEPWSPVESFESSNEDDRHYLFDRAGGRIELGVAVQLPDGRMRRYGAVPPAPAPLRLEEYRVGGGVRGNVRATSLRVMRLPVPHVRSVENRRAATGGVDPETVEQAMTRLPLFLRHRARAVTVDDFAELAREASPDVGRAHAFADDGAGAAAGAGAGLGVRVLVVPNLPEGVGLRSPIDAAALRENPDMMTAVARFLDERRMVGLQVLVTPARYVPLRVHILLRPSASSARQRVEQAAQEALYRLLHPLVGGEDGRGWPFGQDVQAADLHAALQRVDGVASVDSVTLLQTDGIPIPRVTIPDTGLPLSLGHAVELS